MKVPFLSRLRVSVPRVSLLRVSFLLVLATAPAGAQRPVPPDDARAPIRPAARAGEYDVIVEGCVQGDRLTRLAGTGVNDVAAEYLNASEWVLHGPREVMAQLRRAYDRHHVEVTGVAVLPQSLEPRSGDVETRRLPDGTRITIGARRTSPERGSAPNRERAAPVRLEVTSVRVLGERCA